MRQLDNAAVDKLTGQPTGPGPSFSSSDWRGERLEAEAEAGAELVAAEIGLDRSRHDWKVGVAAA